MCEVWGGVGVKCEVSGLGCEVCVWCGDVVWGVGLGTCYVLCGVFSIWCLVWCVVVVWNMGSGIWGVDEVEDVRLRCVECCVLCGDVCSVRVVSYGVWWCGVGHFLSRRALSEVQYVIAC